MMDLTEAMGIGSPSIYAAFGSKEALFREAVAHYISTDGAEIWGAVTEASTAYRSRRGLLDGDSAAVQPARQAERLSGRAFGSPRDG